MRGRYVLKRPKSRTEALRLSCQESSTTSIETLGRARKCRTGSGGAFKKHRTLCQPRAPSCWESSRAKISPAPMRYGSNPNTDTTTLFFDLNLAFRRGANGRKTEILFLSRGTTALQAAPSIPPLRPVIPDLADGRGPDVADGRHPETGKHIAVRQNLNVGERGANRVPQMRGVRLHRHAHGIRVEEVRDHSFQLLHTVANWKSLLFKGDQLADGRHRPIRIAGPVAAGLEPVGIFRRIVILLDSLIKNLQTLLGGEMGDVCNVMQILGHDHRLQPYVESGALLGAHAPQSFNRAGGFLEEFLASADYCMRIADSIQRHRHPPGIRQCDLLDARLIVPVTVGQNFRIQADRSGMRQQIRCIRPKQSLAPAEKYMSWAEPGAQIG